MTDDLFRIVRTDALYDRPIPERHRIVFYIGHLEAFDWNLIAGQALGPDLLTRNLIASLPSASIPWAAAFPTDQPSDWPRLPEVDAYNHRVREELDRILSDDVAGPGEPLAVSA